MTCNPSSSCQGNLLKTGFDIPLAMRLACLKDLCAEAVTPASAGPQNTLADRTEPGREAEPDVIVLIDKYQHISCHYPDATSSSSTSL